MKPLGLKNNRVDPNALVMPSHYYGYQKFMYTKNKFPETPKDPVPSQDSDIQGQCTPPKPNATLPQTM